MLFQPALLRPAKNASSFEGAFLIDGIRTWDGKGDTPYMPGVQRGTSVLGAEAPGGDQRPT
jgi:hypothetical protein